MGDEEDPHPGSQPEVLPECKSEWATPWASLPHPLSPAGYFRKEPLVSP